MKKYVNFLNTSTVIPSVVIAKPGTACLVYLNDRKFIIRNIPVQLRPKFADDILNKSATLCAAINQGLLIDYDKADGAPVSKVVKPEQPKIPVLKDFKTEYPEAKIVITRVNDTDAPVINVDMPKSIRERINENLDKAKTAAKEELADYYKEDTESATGDLGKPIVNPSKGYKKVGLPETKKKGKK